VTKALPKKAGVKEGDIINNVNGVAVKSVSELQEQIGRYRPGDKITINIIRDNKEQKLNVELKNQQGSFDIVKAQAGDEVLGGTFKELSAKMKRELGVDYGVEINSLSKGKLADQGIKPGFIILKINNMPVRNASDIKDAYNSAINNGEQDKVLLIAGLYPNGKLIFYAINLAD
jgi:serine protease Do